jgi:ABC-type transporter Mla maintaining outer membrane lipid asymmetry ATPase subunit MlaF
MADDSTPRIVVRDLTMAFGSFVVMRDVSFEIRRGSIFFIMGGSGCGKSTLLRHMIGLNEPAKGEVFYGDVNFTQAAPDEREKLLRCVGVLYQSGALWSSMTLGENIGLPLGEFTSLSAPEIEEVSTQRWHAEARRPGARHGARPRHPLPRRALGRPRPDQLPHARRADRRAARQPRSHDRDRVARAGEHPVHR